MVRNEAELISLAEAAEMCGLSTGYLRYLAGKKRIWARKIGRNWVTTAAAVKEYVSKGIRPGPRPRKHVRRHDLET